MRLIQRLFGRDEKRLQVQGGWSGGQGFAPKAGWTANDYLPPTVGVFTEVGRADAGIQVNELVALTASAVYACTNIVSSTIATLPIRVLRTEDQAVQKSHPLATLLTTSPNEFMTAATFWTTLMMNALLWGHGNAFIAKDEMGVPIGLYPLRSAVTRPIRMFGELLYVTLVGTTFSYLRPDQIFSVVNMTVDGITPISPIQEARQSVGLSLALEKYAAKFFSNGGNVGGVLSLPPGMKENAIQNFVDSWKKNYAGSDNALKVAVLPEGYKFTSTTTEPEKAQAIQSRVHQVREVARIFRVPLHKLGDLERATFTNIEQQSIEFMQDCIQPWAVRVEQEICRKLLLEREKPELEIKFDLDALLRADTAARYAGYTQGRQGGWLSINDIRAKEGLPPVEGGDALLQPLNMVPVNNQKPGTVPQPDSAGRALIEDAARRVLTKESKALARAAKKHAGKPDELRAWAADWYATHAALVGRTFAAPLKAAGLEAKADEYAKFHCAESVRAIASALETGAAFDDLADEWEGIRPGEIADRLLSR